jgi:hypothetical protein
MLHKIAAATTLILMVIVHAPKAEAACSSYPYTLTNGTTADATQVMANFNCAALTSGATLNAMAFTGANTMQSPGTASDPLVIKNHSAAMGIEMREDASSYLKEYFYDHTGSTTNVFLGGEGPSYFLNSVGVGTSTSGGWNGNAELEADTGVSGYALSGYTTYTGGSGGGALLLRVNTTAVYFSAFSYNGSVVGTITTNGTTTSYNTTSDERLKDWGVPQRDYSGIIKNLWVGDFNWKKTGVPDFGYRAQQTYALFPEAVRKPSDPQNSWQMDYGKTAALAMWGVKDLYKDTDSQSRNISVLQTQVKELSARTAALQQVHANEVAELEHLEQLVTTLQRKHGLQTAQK